MTYIKLLIVTNGVCPCRSWRVLEPTTLQKGIAIVAHLDSLAGQLEEASRDGHHPGVLRVKGSQERRGVAVEVLLVVDEALGEEGHVAHGEVVDDGTIAAVFLHERYPYVVTLDCVKHLQADNDREQGGGGG